MIEIFIFLDASVLGMSLPSETIIHGYLARAVNVTMKFRICALVAFRSRWGFAKWGHNHPRHLEELVETTRCLPCSTLCLFRKRNWTGIFRVSYNYWMEDDLMQLVYSVHPSINLHIVFYGKSPIVHATIAPSFSLIWVPKHDWSQDLNKGIARLGHCRSCGSISRRRIWDVPARRQFIISRCGHVLLIVMHSDARICEYWCVTWSIFYPINTMELSKQRPGLLNPRHADYQIERSFATQNNLWVVVESNELKECLSALLQVLNVGGVARTVN